MTCSRTVSTCTHACNAQELEALLTIYLNKNWDRMELVKSANALDNDDDSCIAAATPISADSHHSQSMPAFDKEATAQSPRPESTGANFNTSSSVL